MPKAELHVHIEGTLEPELAFAIGRRNGIPLPYPTPEAMRAACTFHDLQSFLDVYYGAAAVLLTEQDFHDLAIAYLERAHADNVVRAEIFFDPQTHTARGVPIGTVIAVELDSSELGNPPEKFREVFARARRLGLHAVAHAGEEGPPASIAGALDALRAERIDHGVRCLEDETLVARLVRDRVPLTVCPFSNVKLRVFGRLADHCLPRLLAAGLKASVHCDDPAYFGGFLNDNLRGVFRELPLTAADAYRLARNGLESSFAEEERKRGQIEQLDAFFEAAASAGG
jgi:adenosine deaminase